jgi:NAD(P)-dependent dehydrogenase (short-subunit alcohol dehydrogenase family)
MPKTPDYFVGKTIVITGAASGIGRATALIFAREGANVVCADLDADGARRTAETITQQGREALALTTDVTQRAQVNDAVARAIATFGTVDFCSTPPALRSAAASSSRSTTTCWNGRLI